MNRKGKIKNKAVKKQIKQKKTKTNKKKRKKKNHQKKSIVEINRINQIKMI